QTGKEFVPIARHVQVRPIENSDWEAITTLDAQAFGVTRRNLLEELAKQSHRAFVHHSETGTTCGFGLARAGSRAVYLGPIVATSAEAATALLAILTENSPSQKFFWDIPDENAVAKNLAARLGFTIQRPLMRMFLGENRHPGDAQFQFAIADPALG